MEDNCVVEFKMKITLEFDGAWVQDFCARNGCKPKQIESIVASFLRHDLESENFKDLSRFNLDDFLISSEGS